MRPAALALAAASLLAAPPAAAFCGFYVGGGDTRLFNNATQVVLMREGTRTVLSMANDYQGPPERFAMVVPVPVVLQKEQVKTLSRELFDHVDLLDAPRLVEYWEQDPCPRNDGYGYEFSDDPLAAGGFGPNDATIRVRSMGGAPSVRVLNRFTAGEYQIVILGARDSLGLETWLHENGYAIPSGAEAVLRPYVQGGMKFFVAKVDPTKIAFQNGHAALSPLRFHYDTDTFALPVRLGLLNSSGKQDLIVHIVAAGQRYEVANYDNATVPTNLDVDPAARSQFGSFYSAVFDRVVSAHPHAVVTEYAWDTASCDPCPTPPLDADDLRALGAEVLPKAAAFDPILMSTAFVMTRLHARYTRDSLGADLVFRAAPPIAGGREVPSEGGTLERGVRSAPSNNFQARYAIRHPWTGPVTCDAPRRGVWGGDPNTGGRPNVLAAQNLAFVPPAGVDLGAFLGGRPLDTGSSGDDPEVPALHHGGCAGCRVGGDEGRAGGLALLAAAAWLARRRRASR